MKKVYLLLLMACMSFAGYSQTTSSYTFSRTSGTFTSIVGGSGVTTLSDATACTGGSGTSVNSDNGSNASIPFATSGGTFTFNFCGTNYTTCALDANGVLSLSNTGASATPSTTNIAGAGFLMPLWADLNGLCKNVYYQTSGTSPNRVFTVEYNNWGVAGGTASLNFQVKLYEGTNVIQYVYGTSSGSVPTNAVIGIANSTSDYQSLISTSSSSVNSGFNNFCSQPATGTVLQWCIAPATFSVTGGGAFCSGSAGVHVGLNNSTSGISYQLFNSGTATGTALAGTGGALDYGVITTPGVYTVIANATSSCSTTQSGSATVTINPLPTAFSVTGGGGYCTGGAGATIGLSSSTIGVNYQLLIGGSTAVGSPLLGSSFALSFGAQPVVGTYTVLATNSVTSCTNTMTGNAIVSLNPLPTVFSMTGGGGYCLGGSGVAVGLSSSVSGFTYQLFQNGVAFGTAFAGTGAAIPFGTETSASGVTTYSVVATNTATGCQANMSGLATVTLNTLPPVFTVTGGGTYCLGGTGVAVNLAGSTVGVSYQLYNGTTAIGSLVPGTGVLLPFGLQTGSGSYTVVAENATTGCINNMFSSAAVTIAPLPNVYSITGGGGYCAGTTGIAVGLSSSNTGVNYTLYANGGSIGATGGTGSAISFGLETLAATYTVIAVNTATPFCAANMSGTTIVTINPLPVSTYSVTGGGAYCAGGTGVAVGLSNSTTGINYQLFNGSTAIGLPQAGSGGAVPFGLQTAGGSYTVVGTNISTTCSSNMTGSASVTVNALPASYGLTGGGGYCTGSTPVHVGLTNSNTGISYQLYNNTGSGPVIVGTALAGLGGAIDFGTEAAAGSYTVIATNTVTACTSAMSGISLVSVNTLPTAFAVTSTGTSYCFGSAGITYNMGGSNTGVSYQLMNGTTTVGGPVAGTGSALSFGPYTGAGTYTITGINNTTGCSNTMTGSFVVSVNPLPAVYSITGGGIICSGSGAHVGMGSSAALGSGITYQLYNSGSPVGGGSPATGSTIDFGLETAAGTYTVVATNGTTGCQNNMAGIAVISVNALPALFNITGGGSYCTGTTGVHVGLLGSAIGYNYQLYVGATPVAAPMAGTGSAIDFGTETTAGTYTVVATNNTTGCSRTMTGTTTVVINALPTIHNVTGGGGYCHGGIGDSIGLNIADAGVSYRLFNGTAAVGTAITGAGSAISFGAWTTPGTYTIVATNTTTGCSSNMNGSAAVSVFSLPLTFNVTGGGAYCAGGTGVEVHLSSSTTGVNYQLYNGSSSMGTLPGTGIALNFGLETVAGSYTVIASNSTTGCTNTMFGSANVVVNALPGLHTVGGGGSYCSAGAGLPISLDNSDLGIHYQLLDGGVVVPGAVVIGTGFPVNFAAQTAAGTYTVVGSNLSTTCTNTMTGSATINIISLPTAYTVSGGGHYCSGGSGVTITLSNSETTSTYQLYNGGTPYGTAIAGTGGTLTFTSVTGAGTYTIMASNATTTCNNVMTGTATVVIDPLPTQYIVSGGGAYCAGGTGVHVTLTGSNTGVSYQLVNTSPVGLPVTGTGFALDFGLQTAAGTYTIMATNGTTACVNNMSSSVNVSINPLPVRYSTLSVGSNYCAGGIGIPVSLSNSDAGISYQLYDGSTSAGTAIAGTGGGISFGYQTAAGVYRIIAENPATGCMDTMTSTASVVIDPLPATYTITGGGTYCLGAAGDHIGLSNSNTGITYALYHNSVYTGTTLSGLGTALDFGIETTAGAYTVVATNTATTCTSNMSGIAIVSVNPVPAAYTILGGGPYCAGGSGADISLTGSTLDVDYQAMNGLLISGAPVHGTGTVLDLGPRTAAGTYSIVATNTLTGCSSTMTGTVAVSINPLPTVFSVTGGGGFCPGAAGVHVGISGSETGISYQPYDGTTATLGSLLGSSTSGSLDFGLADSAGSYTVIATNSATGCINTMSGSATVVINPLPTVYNVTGGGSYCAGTAGVHIGLSSSASDVSYTLYNTTTSTTIGSFPGGSGTPLDFGLETVAGTYTVSATNTTTTCGSNMAGSAVVVINPVVVPTVLIQDARHSDTLCSGTFTTFSALTTNAGSGPSYSWTVNGHTASASSTYSYIPANGDVIGVTLVSNATCATPPSVSNSITLTVLPQEDPTVSVSSNHGLQICLGTMTTFTADPGYGGTDATYQWFVDGHVIGGATTATYGYTPANGDNVYVIMTSNYVCRLSNTITSTPLHIEVDSPAIPVVTIVANPSNHISTGETVNFDVTLVNGSSSPTYQWSVNHIPIGGATAPTFSYNEFANLDSVTCQVTTGGGCAGLIGFNSIAMYVSNVGVKQVNAANSDVKLIPNPNKGTFSISGTLGTTVNEEVTVEITDMIGQVIYTTKTMSQNGAIDQKIQLGNNVANGTYLLSIHSESTNQVYHLVIAQ